MGHLPEHLRRVRAAVRDIEPPVNRLRSRNGRSSPATSATPEPVLRAWKFDTSSRTSVHWLGGAHSAASLILWSLGS